MSFRTTVFRGHWVPKVYAVGDTVEDNGWLMHANKTTVDRAAPQPDGDPIFLISGEVFATPQQLGATIMGHRYKFNGLVFISSYRFFAPDATIGYSVLLRDVSDPANIRTIGSLLVPSVPAVGWQEINFGGATIYSAGDVIELSVSYRKAASTGQFSHPWTFGGTATGDPGSSRFTRNDAFTLLQISDIDDNSVDRSADLGGLFPGDSFELSEQTSSSRLDHYTIESVADQGTYFEYGVTRTVNGGEIRANRLCNIIGISEGVDVNVDFVVDAGFWAANPIPEVDVLGFVAGDFDDIPTSLTDNAYGTDIKANTFSVSSDWDLMAVGTGAASGGASAEELVLAASVSDNNVVVLRPFDEAIVLADASLGQVIQNLPPAGSVQFTKIHIKKIDATSNRIRITPDGSDTIDGEIGADLSRLNDSLTLFSTGFGWLIL